MGKAKLSRLAVEGGKSTPQDFLCVSENKKSPIG
jgi:hypothetical protein